MSKLSLQENFRQKISAEISVKQEGKNRYVIYTPFMFEDGDHFVIILKKESGKWCLTDEGHTFMHVGYEDIDIEKGTRAEIIESILASFSIENIEGQLIIRIENEDYGDALYSYIQGLVQISDIRYLKRERVRSTFLEDFKEFITEKVPEKRYEFNWHDYQNDPKGIYPVDCRINGSIKPIYIFALLSDDKTRDATINLLQFEKWGLSFKSLAIFEEQEKIGRKVLARFSDVCEKQYSNLESNRNRIESYIQDLL